VEAAQEKTILEAGDANPEAAKLLDVSGLLESLRKREEEKG